MTHINAYVIILYGVIVTVGGFIGHLKAQSLPSLIMGLAFGVLLLASGWGMLKQNHLAYFSGVALSGILTLFFAYRFFLTGSFMPAGMMAILSLAVLVFTVASKR